MPVKLAEDAILDALAVLEEWDREAARGTGAMFESMGWEREGSLLLRCDDVQPLRLVLGHRPWVLGPGGRGVLDQ